MDNKGEIHVATLSEVSCTAHGNGVWSERTNDEKDVKPEVCNDDSARPVSLPHQISATDTVDDTERDKNVKTGRRAKAPTIISAIKKENSDPRKKNRRVYFPEGGTVVAGYMDPPKPWNDAASCSTEELVCAYQVACEKHGVKVIPKLLQQLQAVNDFMERNETLSLRGEKLDLRHCETIEEILRRVQFRAIDLEATHLDVEGAVALFDMIEFYQSATRLNISYNRNVGPRGWQAFARMLRKTPCLEQLEARSCAISEQVMPMLGRSLRMGSLLTTLHLENSIMSGRHLNILVMAIKMNETLRELYLADNRLMPSDCIQLGKMLKCNNHLQLLDVRNNHLLDVGTSHLCDGICEQEGAGLSTLVLWNNQLTYQSMSAVGRALVMTKSLQTLNLGHNNITNEGIFRLKDGLLRNKSLLRIGMQAVRISCEGAVALAEFIADSARLLRIDLRENDVKTAGLMALSLSFKVSPTLTRLDLDKEPKKESGVKDYAEQQRRLMQDILMYGQRNRELARKREEQEKLEVIRLREEAELREAEGDEDAGPVDRQPDLEEAVEERQGEVNPVDNLKHNLHLNLTTSGATRELTLESPAFVSEAALPIPDAPAEQESVATPVDSAGIDDVAIDPEYPLSPVVVSDGKTILTPVQRHPLTMIPSPPELPPTCQVTSLSTSPGAAGWSPQTSPNSRRRFVICRVKEHSASRTRPLAIHGQLPADSNGLSVSVQASAANTQSSATATDTVLDNVDTSQPVASNAPSQPRNDVSGRDHTVVCVRGLIDSIVDEIIHDVIGRYECEQLTRVSERGDTRSCQLAVNAQRLVDTGCGDVSQSGACAANDTGVRVATATTVGQLDNIPRVGADDSGLVSGDTTKLSLPVCTGTRDITSGDSERTANSLTAIGDVDQTRQACPVTVHNSNHVSEVVSGGTAASLANESVSFGDSASESVSSVNNASESVSSVNNASESVSSVNNASESVSSVNSASESVSCVNSASESVSCDHSASESVSSVNNASESVSSVNSVSQSVSSVNSASESVSSVNSASESVSSVNNASESVSCDHSASESVSSVNNASESVSSVNSASESVSSVNSASQFVSYVNSASQSVSSVNSASESVSSVNNASESVPCDHSASESVSSVNNVSESVSSVNSASESVSSVNSASESVSSVNSASESVSYGHSAGAGLDKGAYYTDCESTCERAQEVASPSCEPTVFDPAAAGTHNLNTDVSPNTDKTHAYSPELDRCHAIEGVSLESVELVLSPESDHCHVREEVSSKSNHCHVGNDTYNTVAKLAPLEKCSQTAALTVSPCQQSSGTAGVTVSMCHQTECSDTVSPCHQAECSGTVSPCHQAECSGTVSPCHQAECSGTVSPCHQAECSRTVSHQTEPNLHSALTMNGMRVELASVLDSLDQQFDPLASHHELVSLDNTEQEIEGMLACVHGDETTKTGLSGVDEMLPEVPPTNTSYLME